MVNLPSGTVTFVFSDIEGSTRLLKQLGDTDYAALLTVHRRLVREIFAAHDGHEIDTQGDAFFYSFVRARQAVAAATELQRAHAKASWPRGMSVRVRLGLHTGEPAIGDEGYTGLDVVRASRIAAVGDGGQILLSDTTRAIVANDLPDGVRLRSLGDRSLKDIDQPEPLTELVLDGDGAAPAPRPEPDGDSGAEKEEPSASPMREFAAQTRQRIESRVLAQLRESLGGQDWPIGPPPPVPSAPPKRSTTREIARLHELREQGALTETQYQRAVDRLLDSPASE